MRQKILLLLSLVLTFGLFSAASAQTADNPLKPSLVMGDVTSLGANKIVLQTKDGSLEIALTDKTEYKRASAEKPSLSTAVPSTLSEISVNDKVVVTGFFTTDKKSLNARAVYLMTKSDIAQKQTKESEAWKTRSIAGKVVSINPQTKQISIEVRGLTGSQSVVLTPKENAKFKRYAPNSINYNEAKSSSIGELSTGDQLRALGDKSADGANFTAEEIISGAFQTVAGTVKSIDVATGEVVISDIQTKKDLTIVIGTSTTVKKFPEEMAQRMAMAQAMQAGGVRPGGQGTGQQGGQTGQGGMRPQGNAPQGEQSGQTGQGRGGFGGGMRNGQGGIDEMLERFPTITVADLKVGDSIAASSTKTANSDKITAIKLLAGVEAFLKAPQVAGGGRGGQGQGGQGGFTIPGLDGFDN